MKIKEILRNFDGQISLSVDVLRHENFDLPYDCFCCNDYLCLSVHLTDESWKLKKWVTNFRRVWDLDDVSPHEAILEALQDWGIDNKVSTLTMVNSDFYGETVEFVKDHIQRKEFQLNGQLFQVHCCGKIISLMVQDAFEEMKDIIDKVRELYSFRRFYPLWYHTSCSLNEALECGLVVNSRQKM